MDILLFNNIGEYKKFFDSVEKNMEDGIERRIFDKFKENRGITYIYSSDFTGFVSNGLPSFWSTGASKSFR
jgi:hypothetical protein